MSSPRLTKIESDVLHYLLNGLGQDQIASARGVTRKAVEHATRKLREKYEDFYGCCFPSTASLLAFISRKREEQVKDAESQHESHLDSITRSVDKETAIFEDSVHRASRRMRDGINSAIADPSYRKWGGGTVAMASLGLLFILGSADAINPADTAAASKNVPAVTVSGNGHTVLVGNSESSVGYGKPTVDHRSETAIGDYWVSSSRGNRAVIHSVECRYHKMQTKTGGASDRLYYDTLDAAKESHPKCGACKRCLGTNK